MTELLAQIVAVARGMWRFRWPGVAVAWLVAIIGTVIVLKIPNQYEAAARIHVDTQSILKPLMSGLAVQPNVEQQVGMLSRTLISRPNLEKLVRMADLDLASTSKAEQDALIDRLTKTVKISSTARDNLFTLSVREQDQEKAKRIIQSLVSIFVESSLGTARKDTDSAKVFLDEQIKNFEGKLSDAEARLKEFRLRNLDMRLAEGGDAASRLTETRKQLEDARLQLREAERAAESVKAQIEAEQKQGTSRASARRSLLDDLEVPAQVSTPEVDARIDALKRNLDGLRQRYTDMHPDVVNARRLLAELEAQRKKEVAELRKTAAAAAAAAAQAGGGETVSPVLQELNRMLASAEVQVASLRARVNEFNERLNAAKNMLKTAPQIEAEAAQLNREYEVTKRNYENLVGRRQSAVMSGDLESASGMADFRLIDPPRVSPKPVFPNRTALLPMALVAGLAAGLAIAFVGSQVRPVFGDAAALRAATRLPMLGVVSAVLGDAEQRAERMDKLRFLAASGGLVVLFAAGLVAMSIMATRLG